MSEMDRGISCDKLFVLLNLSRLVGERMDEVWRDRRYDDIVDPQLWGASETLSVAPVLLQFALTTQTSAMKDCRAASGDAISFFKITD